MLILCVGAGLPGYVKFRKYWRRRSGREIHKGDNIPLKSRMVGALVFVMYYLFPSTIIGLFKTFYCTEKIGSTYGDAEMTRYFMTDLKIVCFEDDHLFSAWVAVILLILYIVAVPGAIGYVTTKNRDKLYTPEYQLKYGFLYNGFEEGREWWEVVVLGRKTIIAVVIVYFKDPFIQSFAAVIILTMSLYVQLEFKPYREQLLNRVEELGLTTALFTQSPSHILQSIFLQCSNSI